MIFIRQKNLLFIFVHMPHARYSSMNLVMHKHSEPN